jgi:hypothetical protein
MKVTVNKPIEIEVKYIIICVPVRYDEEDIPNDFPFRRNDIWEVLVDIETGKIKDWPYGYEYVLVMKVCDSGYYQLLDEAFGPIAEIEDYVPHGIVPGSYGDYIELTIEKDGTISNWPEKPDVSAFFPYKP